MCRKRFALFAHYVCLWNQLVWLLPWENAIKHEENKFYKKWQLEKHIKETFVQQWGEKSVELVDILQLLKLQQRLFKYFDLEPWIFYSN